MQNRLIFLIYAVLVLGTMAQSDNSSSYSYAVSWGNNPCSNRNCTNTYQYPLWQQSNPQCYISGTASSTTSMRTCPQSWYCQNQDAFPAGSNNCQMCDKARGDIGDECFANTDCYSGICDVPYADVNNNCIPPPLVTFSNGVYTKRHCLEFNAQTSACIPTQTVSQFSKYACAAKHRLCTGGSLYNANRCYATLSVGSVCYQDAGIIDPVNNKYQPGGVLAYSAALCPRDSYCVLQYATGIPTNQIPTVFTCQSKYSLSTFTDSTNTARQTYTVRIAGIDNCNITASSNIGNGGMQAAPNSWYYNVLLAYAYANMCDSGVRDPAFFTGANVEIQPSAANSYVGTLTLQCQPQDTWGNGNKACQFDSQCLYTPRQFGPNQINPNYNVGSNALPNYLTAHSALGTVQVKGSCGQCLTYSTTGQAYCNALPGDCPKKARGDAKCSFNKIAKSDQSCLEDSCLSYCQDYCSSYCTQQCNANQNTFGTVDTTGCQKQYDKCVSDTCYTANQAITCSAVPADNKCYTQYSTCLQKSCTNLCQPKCTQTDCPNGQGQCLGTCSSMFFYNSCTKPTIATASNNVNIDTSCYSSFLSFFEPNCVNPKDPFTPCANVYNSWQQANYGVMSPFDPTVWSWNITLPSLTNGLQAGQTSIGIFGQAVYGPNTNYPQTSNDNTKTCTKYVCASAIQTEQWQIERSFNNYCIDFKQSTGTVYLRTCPQNFTCVPNFFSSDGLNFKLLSKYNNPQNSDAYKDSLWTCMRNIPGDVGDSCLVNEDCFSGQCFHDFGTTFNASNPVDFSKIPRQGQCAVSKQNDPCISDNNCDKGLYCQGVLQSQSISQNGGQKKCFAPPIVGSACSQKNDRDICNMWGAKQRLSSNQSVLYGGLQCARSYQTVAQQATAPWACLSQYSVQQGYSVDVWGYQISNTNDQVLGQSSANLSPAQLERIRVMCVTGTYNITTYTCSGVPEFLQTQTNSQGVQQQVVTCTQDSDCRGTLNQYQISSCQCFANNNNAAGQNSKCCTCKQFNNQQLPYQAPDASCYPYTYTLYPGGKNPDYPYLPIYNGKFTSCIVDVSSPKWSNPPSAMNNAVCYQTEFWINAQYCGGSQFWDKLYQLCRDCGAYGYGCSSCDDRTCFNNVCPGDSYQAPGAGCTKCSATYQNCNTCNANQCVTCVSGYSFMASKGYCQKFALIFTVSLTSLFAMILAFLIN